MTSHRRTFGRAIPDVVPMTKEQVEARLLDDERLQEDRLRLAEQRRNAPNPELAQPTVKLANINPGDALATAYIKAKHLYEAVEFDETVPTNQKAQTLSAVTAILVQISKAQKDTYTAERQKTLEEVLVSVLKEFPEMYDSFVDKYKAALTAEGDL